MGEEWHPTWIEVDVGQFRRNVRGVRNFIRARRYCLPIKANAYGHGLTQMAKVAEEEGVDYLGVAHACEGVVLRKAGIQIPIFVMGAIHQAQVADLLKYDLEISVSSRLKAELIREECKVQNRSCRVHIEVDTGMHRTGMRPETALSLYQELSSDPCFEIVGIYSHLANADSNGREQIERFQEVCKLLPSQPLIRHIANSTGVLAFPESAMDMVRPALLSFGYVPEANRSTLPGVSPCFSLKSTVSYFKVVEKGRGIGYGHTFHTERTSRIVTIPVGYGDGYRRDLSNKGEVLIRGKRYPIVGTICMDQFMVDVGGDDVFVGDEVVLIGRQGGEEIRLEQVADQCNTIPYEILCGLNERVPRIYVS